MEEFHADFCCAGGLQDFSLSVSPTGGANGHDGAFERDFEALFYNIPEEDELGFDVAEEVGEEEEDLRVDEEGLRQDIGIFQQLRQAWHFSQSPKVSLCILWPLPTSLPASPLRC